MNFIKNERNNFILVTAQNTVLRGKKLRKWNKIVLTFILQEKTSEYKIFRARVIL